MGIVVNTLSDEIDLKPGSVRLRVKIGNGQLGAITGKLDSQILFMGNLVDMEIGNGEDLKGKTLFIDGSVKDIQTNNDVTIVTVELINGGESKSFTSKKSADTNGGTVIHDIEIELS